MKISASIFVLIFSSFFISCSKTEDLQIKQPNSEPILEMSTELIGLWDVNGEMLDFRLYDNGLVEFDALDKSKKDPKKPISKTNDLKVKKQGYISEQEVGKILNLLKGGNFLGLKDTYMAKRAGTDNSINNTIVFQYENKEKTIKILSHLEDLSNPNLENFPDFPPVLSDLYKQTGKIKTQLLKE
jgi:hypothetical protein